MPSLPAPRPRRYAEPAASLATPSTNGLCSPPSNVSASSPACRRFRFRSLPWLGAYALLAMSLDLVMPRVLVPVIYRGILRSSVEFHLMWQIGDVVLRRLTGLLLAVMVMAEIAALLARLSPGPEQRALRLIQEVRERSVPLGLALLGLTLAQPLVVAILWLVESAATVVRTAAG